MSNNNSDYSNGFAGIEAGTHHPQSDVYNTEHIPVPENNQPVPAPAPGSVPVSVSVPESLSTLTLTLTPESNDPLAGLSVSLDDAYIAALENSQHMAAPESSPPMTAPESSPPMTAPESSQPMAAPESSQPMAAPFQRTDAPVPEPEFSARRPFQTRIREAAGARFPAQNTEDWREPSYSQAQEPAQDMYTPGIYPSPQHTRKRVDDVKPERVKPERGSRIGKLVRAACLIVICAMLSGAASYAVLEYRVQRGDFEVNVNNQVVIGGGNTGTQPVSGLTAPISTSGSELSAELIYDMALSQVVGIESESPSTGAIPGIQSNTTPVSGSGFIISNDGYILTNYHVIEIADVNSLEIRVYLSDETVHIAQVIGYDSSSDVALIKIDATDLTPVVIGDSDAIRVGQRVYAVGNPFGDLFHTMTEGIISALDRSVTVDNKRINAFQFDAAVNPGNSGGPIYDHNGDVIGIVSMKIMGNSVEGIGFAIPINDAILIAKELIEHGYITGRPLIGITVNSVTRGNADYYDLVGGARVRSLNEGSAGERAGLKVGDIIVALGDVKVDSSEALSFAMRKYKAGDTTTITVWREGEEITLKITFDENLAAGQPLRP